MVVHELSKSVNQLPSPNQSSGENKWSLWTRVSRVRVARVKEKKWNLRAVVTKISKTIEKSKSDRERRKSRVRSRRLELKKKL